MWYKATSGGSGHVRWMQLRSRPDWATAGLDHIPRHKCTASSHAAALKTLMDARCSKICLEICVELSKCRTASSQECRSAVSQATQSETRDELDMDYDVLSAARQKSAARQQLPRDPDKWVT